jgi:hypothetical protein
LDILTTFGGPLQQICWLAEIDRQRGAEQNWWGCDGWAPDGSTVRRRTFVVVSPIREHLFQRCSQAAQAI